VGRLNEPDLGVDEVSEGEAALFEVLASQHNNNKKISRAHQHPLSDEEVVLSAECRDKGSIFALAGNGA
jgi:hypothetical protein